MGDGKNSARHIFLAGGSGAGKTRLVKGYAQKNPGHIEIDENGTEYDIRPVVYVELPNPFTVQEFYQTILTGLGAPMLPGRPTTGDLKRQVLKLIIDQKVEMLILDEMDYLLSSKYVKPLEGMDVIKHIGNLANVSLVCVGTPDAGELRKKNNQYFRRFMPIYLDRFVNCDGEFCEFLNKIEEQLGLPFSIGLGNIGSGFPMMLHSMCRGLVGILTPTIQEAYRLLGVFDNEITDLKKFKLSVNTLVEAYNNTIGDLTEAELNEITKSQDEKTSKNGECK